VARDAEIAVTVEDPWQHHGLGRHLTRHLAVLARDRGYDTFVARILPDNRAALGLMQRLAPDARLQFADGDYEARFPLTDAVQPPMTHGDRQPPSTDGNLRTS
jgi:GNAT superfamily N-acetyltransferase